MYNLRVFAIFVLFCFMDDFFKSATLMSSLHEALGYRIKLGKTDIALFKPSLTRGRGWTEGCLRVCRVMA